MRFLYGRHYRGRLESVAEEIPNGAQVLHVCCGDCALKTLELKDRASYTGVDINPRFIKHARKLSIPAFSLDVRTDELPSCDYVVMQGSLYQFIPEHKKIVDKLLASAVKKVIISEPIITLSGSRNPLVAFIARRSANPGTGHKHDRFNDHTFRAFIQDNYKDRVEKYKLIPGGKDLMVILNAEKGLRGAPR